MSTIKQVFMSAIALSLLPAVGWAESKDQSPSVRYEAEFFGKFAPRTALDMVKQVPSFSLQDIDEDKRGYAAAAGNVLIDGERPSTKSQTLEDILQRIPAGQVLRIEVLRGSDLTGDRASDSLMVNVVRTPAAGSGVWSTGFELAQQHEPAPNGYASWAGRIGKVDYGLGVNTYSLKRELPGRRRVTDGDGVLQETRDEESPREFEEYAINGEVSRALFGGRLRATGQAYRSHYHQDNSLESRSTDDIFLGDELTPYSENKKTLEFGTNFEISGPAWQSTLATIFTRTRFDGDTRVTERDADLSEQSVFRQLQVRDTGESIVRGIFARSLGQSNRLEFGIEGALNTLDADLDLSGVFGGVTVPIEVPNANISLDEKRSEAYVSHSWHAGPWSAESRLAAEVSRLEFTGDVEQVVDLSYIKPSLQLSRAFGTQHQWRARVYRDVGQLDFADFASVVSLSDDLIDGGNPNLKPETSWRAELGVDLRFASQAALGVRVYHYWVSDVVDLVPLAGADGRIAAPGNIGSGDVDGMQVTFATPLPSFIPGGTLTVDATLQQASVVDPQTHRERTISDFEGNKVKAAFRQDTHFHELSWGINYTAQSSRTDYRLDQTDRTRESPSLDVFVERAITGSIKLNLSVMSVQGSPALRRRSFYDGDRNGSLLSVEDAHQSPGRWIVLRLSGNM
ncbi:MAG: TonB-dependent receptor plug domain-containing protein [Povalibacter sp.]